MQYHAIQRDHLNKSPCNAPLSYHFIKIIWNLICESPRSQPVLSVWMQGHIKHEILPDTPDFTGHGRRLRFGEWVTTPIVFTARVSTGAWTYGTEQEDILWPLDRVIKAICFYLGRMFHSLEKNPFLRPPAHLFSVILSYDWNWLNGVVIKCFSLDFLNRSRSP